jgi:prepilin-type N-terminal cleavage/methylation domain-containing protein
MKSSQRGVTLVEIIVVVAITGLIAGLGIAKLLTFQKIRKLDGEARALYGAMVHARAQVLKKDRAYLMKFITSGTNRYEVYEDADADGVADAGEIVSRQNLAAQVSFGSPSGGPASGPGGTGNPLSKVEGNWTTAMLFDRDRAVTINTGTLYMQASSINRRVYCIRMPAGTRQLQLWRWDGTWVAI